MSRRSERKDAVLIRLKKWTKRIALSLLGLALAAMLFHAYATHRTAQKYPIPGTLVDIGEGRRLHYHSQGQGQHTLVIDAGLSGGSYDFETIQKSLSDVAKVCTYDRGGYGWSDHIAGPRTSQQIVAELHELLHRADDIDLPVVLVGHSFGGQNVRLYASTYPEDVEALVLIDALNTDEFTEAPPLSQPPLHFKLMNATHRLGTQRIFMRLLMPDDTPKSIRHCEMLSRSKTATAIYRELVGLANWESVRESMRHLGDTPVVILSAGVREDPDSPRAKRWETGQAGLANNVSSNARHVVAEESGHNIQSDAPNLVITEIRDLLGRLNTNDES